MSEQPFLVQLHADSCRQLGRSLAGAQPPQRHVATRGPVEILLASQEVWSVIFATCTGVAPAIFASILSLLWKDFMGEEDVRAADAHRKFAEVMEKLKDLEKKDERTAAALRQLQAEIQKAQPLSPQVTEKITRYLVDELGWSKDKAAKGVGAVHKALSQRSTPA
jgi:hypothetical protein